MRSRPVRLAVLAVFTAFAAVVGAGCASGADHASPMPSAIGASTPPSAAGGPTIGNRTFVSTRASGRTLVAGTTVTLTFRDGGLHASAGCNSIVGEYSVVGRTLRVDQLGSTAMACAAELMAQDEWLVAFLPGATVELRESGMTLTKAGVALEFVDRQTPNVSLEGTPWVVDGLVSGETVSSMPQGVMATLAFADQRFTVRAGCNSGGGTAQIAKTAITFGVAAITQALCSDAAMAVERHILGVLAGTQPFAIDGTSLTIGAPGALGIHLQATSGMPPSEPRPS